MLNKGDFFYEIIIPGDWVKREWGQFFFLQKNQLRKIFQNLSAREAERFVEAYESIKQIWSVWLLLPMWAIWYLGFLFVYVAMYFTERERGGVVQRDFWKNYIL